MRALTAFVVLVLGWGPADVSAQQRPGAAPAATPLQRQDTEADVNALLDDGATTDPARIERAKSEAAKQPPTSTDHDVLASFFFQRAIAAGEAGLLRQELDDLRQASEHARAATSIDKTQILWRFASTQADRGQRAAAVRTMTEAIGLNPPNRRGRLISLYASLANFNVQAGNIPGADTALAQVKGLRQEMENNVRFQSNPGTRSTIAQAVVATAQVLMLKGSYTEAEAAYRDAIRILEALGKPTDLRRALNARGGVATSMRLQGRLAEAENEVRQVLVVAQRDYGVVSSQTRGALFQLASTLADQGRFVEAENLARKGIEIGQQKGLRGVGSPSILLAHTLVGQGKWQAALAEFETTRRSYQKTPEDFEAFVKRSPVYGLALLKDGRVADARGRFQRLYEANRESLGDKHYMTAESRGFYAMALAANGEHDAALEEFSAAAPIMLSRSRDSSDTDDTGSASAQDLRARVVLEAYIDLLADSRNSDLPARHKIDPVAESFRLADAAHTRGVQRALAASAARSAAANPQIADAARRVQDDEKQISALNGLLANAISARAADRDEGAIRDLRKRIDGLRDERARLLQEIERKFPDYVRLVEPKPAAIADVRGTLRPGEAMAAFYAGEKRTYAWIIPQSGAPVLVAAALGREPLRAVVQGLRKALDPNAATLDDIPAFDVKAAYALYATLLQPAEAALAGVRDLFVVPDDALGQIPLGVLVTAPVAASKEAETVPFTRYRSVPWLVRRMAVTQLPSVGSLAALRALPAGDPNRRAFVGFGDPWFSREQAAEAQREAATQVAGLVTRGVPIRLRSAPKGDANFTAELAQLPRLADTADEVRAVAAALRADPARDLFIGAKASASTIKGLDLSAWRVVMFATHGLVPGDLTGLNQPALALSAPDVTGNAADGLLTTEDILGLKLNADWVVLSACNTAAGQGAGAEAVSGLGRAFFYAGTRALLVSNWPVETASARTLTTDLFRRQVEQPTLTRGEALRQAELGLIDGPGMAGPDGKALFSYAHPIFWAPFSLVGDGGGTQAR
jgi:CHAT domain-containing protein